MTYAFRFDHIKELESNDFIFEKKYKNAVRILNKQMDILQHGCKNNDH